MEPWEWATLLKPLLAFVVLVAICVPVRMAAQRWLPEGRIKRLLLRRL
jgi:hypothetical protein